MLKKYLFFLLLIVGLTAVCTTQTYASELSTKETKEYILKNRFTVEKDGKSWTVIFKFYDHTPSLCKIWELYGTVPNEKGFSTAIDLVELDLAQTVSNGDTIIFVPKLGEKFGSTEQDTLRYWDTTRFSLKCDSLERAKRLRKAFKHLAELFGNKPEKDPFAD